jgi:predicted transcriptional regulator
MRPVVSWMTKSDDVILEFLEEKDIAVPPMVISFNVSGVSYPTVQRRVKELADNGLVTRYDDPQGYVEITEKGRAYLRGDLDASDLEDAG